MDPSEPDRLILACRDDPAAFRALVELFAARLYSFLIHLSGPQSADDLFQEVWLRVFQAAPRYEPRGKAAGWLFKIAHNAARNYFRSRSAAPLQGELPAESPSAEPGPAEAAEAAEMRAAIDAAIAALPEEQRQVFLLREYGGMAFKEIAETLDVPLGTALSRMNAALDKLRGRLGDCHA